MRVSIFGPRVLSEEQQKNLLIVWAKFKESNEKNGIVFLHGGSKGTQETIKNYESATSSDTDIILFKPWHLLNTKLEYTSEWMMWRNIQILQNSDVVIIYEPIQEDSLEWTKNWCDKNEVAMILIKGAGNAN